jgi:hypothetical protein
MPSWIFPFLQGLFDRAQNSVAADNVVWGV